MTCDKRVLLPPSSSEFRRHLLIVMGTLSGWKQDVFVNHKEAKRATTIHAGYDPDNLAKYGNPEDGWRMDGGHASFKSFGRRIWNAYRRGYWLQEIPLTQKGPKKGQWGLTLAGLEIARSYAGPKSIGNTTAQFLDQRLKETNGLKGVFWKTLKGAVASRFPISARSGLLDDHIQTCMMRLIHRDALKERVLYGKPITDTHIATYVVRSAINDIRDSATEPITRELYGARTAKERLKGAVAVNSSNTCKITWDVENGCWDDIVDPILGDCVENKIGFGEVWGELEQVVRRCYSDSWKQHMTFIRMRSEERSIREISNLMEIPISRAYSLKKGIRKCQDVLWKNGTLDGMLKRTLKKPPLKQVEHTLQEAQI